jgi:hypothetical protein
MVPAIKALPFTDRVDNSHEELLDRGWLPGISVFRRERAGLVRLSDAAWAAGDDFCSLWYLLDLLPDGPVGWQPRLHYGPTRRAR